MSVTMPSVEVGTVGGGTTLAAQNACLRMIGCAGANKTTAGLNADHLARTVAGTVLAGEISLIAALASNDLLKSHLALNRKKVRLCHHTDVLETERLCVSFHPSQSTNDAHGSARKYSTFALHSGNLYGEPFTDFFPIP